MESLVVYGIPPTAWHRKRGAECFERCGRLWRHSITFGNDELFPTQVLQFREIPCEMCSNLIIASRRSFSENAGWVARRGVSSQTVSAASSTPNI